MKIEVKTIKIFVIFTSAVAVVLFFVAVFLILKKHNLISLEEVNLSANQPLKFLDIPSLSLSLKAEAIKMTFFGDLMLDRNVGLVIKQKGLDYIFEKIKDTDLFKNKDIIFSNLEGAITNNGVHFPPAVGYDFAFSPETAGQLKNFGFNFFGLANNHITDQGSIGLVQTYQNLDTLGLDYAGCPDGQIGECSGKITEIKNKKIGLAGFSMVYSKLDEDKLRSFISSYASSTDLLIVNMHWGNEYQHNFSQSQQKIAHLLIDAGTDIIIGHHPHVVQGLEVYRGKPIFYSLGNFIFDQYFSKDTQEGLAIEASFEDNQSDFLLEPFETQQNQISLLVGEKKQVFLEELADWSKIDSELFEQTKLGEIILAR